jgi:hypothetical protein
MYTPNVVAATPHNERSMKRPAHDVLAQAFISEDVGTVFTLVGDANMHWSNAMAGPD